jgi:hypothetical protein
MQRRDAGGVRLDRAQAAGVQPPQVRHAVGARTPLELREPRQLVLAERDDELADAVDGDGAALAVGVHARGAVDAQPGLQRAGRVVDAGVDHAAVVAALVCGRRGLALDDEQAAAGAAREHLAGHGEPDDAGPDDEGVVAVGGHRLVEVSPKSGKDGDERG